jgi:uncharacterized OB-fold protein
MSTVSDDELLARLPNTLIDHDNKEYYRGWLERRLVLRRCTDCGAWHHPPRAVCPECWSRNVVPTEGSGHGTVHLLMKLHQGRPSPGVDYSTPHPVATVDLDEGVRFTSTIVNCPLEEMAIGMRVQLAWVDRYDVPYPVFEPESTPAPSAPEARS